MLVDTGDQNVNGKAITVLSDAANRNTRIFFHTWRYLTGLNLGITKFSPNSAGY